MVLDRVDADCYLIDLTVSDVLYSLMFSTAMSLDGEPTQFEVES